MDKGPQGSERHWLFDRWFTRLPKSFSDDKSRGILKGKAWCATETYTISRTKGTRAGNNPYLKEQFSDAQIEVIETADSVKVISIYKSGIFGKDLRRTSQYYYNKDSDTVSLKFKEQFPDGSFLIKPNAKPEKMYRCLNLEKNISQNK